MSNLGLKSRRPGLLLDEENGVCSIVRCCAEFLSIGNHSPKRMRLEGGLSDLGTPLHSMEARVPQ